jgi:hypothetical protein
LGFDYYLISLLSDFLDSAAQRILHGVDDLPVDERQGIHEEIVDNTAVGAGYQ